MNYRPDIDGLRAIAVLGVVIFHAKLSLFGHALLPAGFLGVDIFFVISGYLISRILLSSLKEGTFSLKDFYVRRARRILPALLLLMLVTIPFAWTFLIPHQYESYAQSILATLAFGSNILFWQEAGYFDEPSHLKPLLHTWTLGVEEQYYIIFPGCSVYRLDVSSQVYLFGSFSYGHCLFCNCSVGARKLFNRIVLFATDPRLGIFHRRIDCETGAGKRPDNTLNTIQRDIFCWTCNDYKLADAF